MEGKESVTQSSGLTVSNMLPICSSLEGDVESTTNRRTIPLHPKLHDHQVRNPVTKYFGVANCAHCERPRLRQATRLPPSVHGGDMQPYRSRRGDCETRRNHKQPGSSSLATSSSTPIRLHITSVYTRWQSCSFAKSMPSAVCTICNSEVFGDGVPNLMVM